MPVLTLDLEQPDPQVIRQTIEVIREGKILLYPTDTIYGLGCDPFQPDALRRILEVKGRASSKGLLVLVHSPVDALSLAARVPPTFQSLAARFWPGPVTFLLPASPHLPGLLVGEGGLIGVRCPSQYFLEQLLRDLDAPLVSTSASISGEPEVASVAELRRLFEEKVDLFLDAGELPARRASSVVDLSVDPPRLVRTGEQADEIERALTTDN